MKSFKKKFNSPKDGDENWSNRSFYGIPLKNLFLLTGFIFLVFSFIGLLEILSPTKVNQSRKMETKSKNPVIEAKVFDIASKFICSCGKCNEKSLEVCKCERAIEERNLIRKNTEQKESIDKIVLIIANRYGFLKSEYANNFKVDKSKIWTNSIKNSN